MIRYFRSWPVLAALAALAAFSTAARPEIGDIPERPERLTYPPLNFTPPKADEFRHQLKAGPVAYIVPDHELPLAGITVYIRTGTYVVPEGKEGLTDLTGQLLTRGGAGQWTAEELDEKADFLAARLSSSISDTEGSVSINLLSKDLDEGLTMLRAVLAEPRFQENKIALSKTQLLSIMKQRNDDSSDIEAREADFLGFGERFFINRYPTAASVKSITQNDLKDFHQRWFFPSNFVVAASGDFDTDKLIASLEKMFSSWPVPGGAPPPPIPTNTTFATPGTYLINKDVNQGRVTIMLPGITRDDPRYFAGLVMNDILGGGGFTSHLMSRIRSDEGLAYSVVSHLAGGIYFPRLFTASFQSKSRTVPYAISIVLDELKKMVANPPAEEELQVSKNGFVERFPLNFSTKSRTANLFAEDEITGRYQRDPNYWREYRDRVQKVTAEDVQSAAKSLLAEQKPVVLIVGNRDDILKGHPSYKVDIKQELGKIKELPLRDPLTMKPLPLQ